MRARWLIAGAAVLAALIARADPQEPVRLIWRAQAGCPDEREFVRQLETRTHRAKITDAAAERTLEVEIEGDRATLVISGRGTKQTRRELHAKRCEDAVMALALVAAIAIDPLASTGPIETLSSSDAGEADVAPEAALDAPVETAAPAATSAEDAAPPRAPTHVQPEVYAGGGVLSGPIPGVAPVAGLGGAVSFGHPRVSIEGFVSVLSEAALAPGAASFGAFFGRAGACPVRIGRAFELRPCVHANLGAVVASARGFVGSEQQLAALASVGFGGRATLVLGIFRVALALEAQLAPPRTSASERAPPPRASSRSTRTARTAPAWRRCCAGSDIDHGIAYFFFSAASIDSICALSIAPLTAMTSATSPSRRCTSPFAFEPM